MTMTGRRTSTGDSASNRSGVPASSSSRQPLPLNWHRGDPRLTWPARIWLDVAMKRVKIAELKDQLSRHLRAVERGAEVEVTDRDRPIARIVPVSGTGSTLVVRPPRRPFSEIRRKRH